MEHEPHAIDPFFLKCRKMAMTSDEAIDDFKNTQIHTLLLKRRKMAIVYLQICDGPHGNNAKDYILHMDSELQAFFNI